jgi:hypothetical protein
MGSFVRFANRKSEEQELSCYVLCSCLSDSTILRVKTATSIEFQLNARMTCCSVLEHSFGCVRFQGPFASECWDNFLPLWVSGQHKGEFEHNLS